MSHLETASDILSPGCEKTAAQEDDMRPSSTPRIGDYVLATKYSDGDPGDSWALGFYAGERDEGNDQSDTKAQQRHIVIDSNGLSIRPNGFRRVARIRKDVGAWLLNEAAKQLEASPPGTVNLWTMLTPSAFDVDGEQS